MWWCSRAFAEGGMDFPLFHLDFFDNRLLIAAIAIVHVFHSRMSDAQYREVAATCWICSRVRGIFPAVP